MVLIKSQLMTHYDSVYIYLKKTLVLINRTKLSYTRFRTALFSSADISDNPYCLRLCTQNKTLRADLTYKYYVLYN